MTNEEREMLRDSDDSCPIDQCSGDPARCSLCFWKSLAKRTFAESEADRVALRALVDAVNSQEDGGDLPVASYVLRAKDAAEARLGT